MKDKLFIVIILIIVSIGLPFLSKGKERNIPEKINLYLTDEDIITELTPEEYLVGCLAAQIPIDYEQEALNAQAAAAMTYAVRLMTDFENNNPNIPEGADLSDDGKICQPYYTYEDAVAAYGESYNDYLPSLEKAAAYGAGHIITFNNEPIYSVYHSVSAGKTNSAMGIWGRDFGYIKPVDSKWDESYINFECRNEMTTEQARLSLVSYMEGISTPVDYGKWFSELNADENGYVISVKIGDNVFSGGDIWRIFGLRSTAFTISYQNGIFTFVTKGYGHGAGLSQYGANELAKEGKTAAEILRYYYSGDIEIG